MNFYESVYFLLVFVVMINLFSVLLTVHAFSQGLFPDGANSSCVVLTYRLTLSLCRKANIFQHCSNPQSLKPHLIVP